jgi:hypothetical protein
MYLTYGMSYEQFWNGEPWIARSYYKAEQIKTENNSANAWLQGLYFYDALCVSLSNFSKGLAGKQGKAEYRKEPIRITPKTESEKKAEERKALDAYIESLKQYQADWERAHKEKNNGN